MKHIKNKNNFNKTNESLSDTVNEFMDLLEQFINSNVKNQWLYVDGFKMYVRKSKRLYDGKFIDCIDLAAIESDVQGTGLFTLILNDILKKY